MRLRPLVLACALAALALFTSLASAAWVPGGTLISPLPAQDDGFALFGGAPDEDGGAYLVWLHNTHIDSDPPYSLTRFVAQRVDRDGSIVAGWPAAGRVLRQFDPMGSGMLIGVIPTAVFPDGAHGALVVTRELALVGDYRSYAQVYRLAPDGTFSLLGPEYLGVSNAQQVAVDADGAGGLVFATIARGHAPPPLPAPQQPLLVARVDGTGTVLWTSPEIAPPDHVYPDRTIGVAGDGAGGAFVAWVDVRIQNNGLMADDLYLQRVHADGSLDPAWPADGLPVGEATTYSSGPRLCADGAGGVWVTWFEEPYPGSTSLTLRVSHVLGDGTFAPGMPALGRTLATVDSEDDRSDVRADGLGGLYVLAGELGGPLETRVALHRLAPDGLPRPGWPLEGLTLDPRAPGPGPAYGALAVDDAHGVFAAWQIPLASPTGEILVNEFASNAQPAPGWLPAGQVLAASTTVYGRPSATRSDAGAIIAWTDQRHLSGAVGLTVYAQRVLPDGPVATTAALVSAEAGADGVRVRWSVTLDGASGLAVERRREGGAWSVIARPLPDGDGRVEVVDVEVEPGARYAYRLTWTERGVAGASSPVWVSVPAMAALSLRVGPNPAERASEVRFALPRAGRASVRVLDVSGRAVRTLARGTLAAGEHVRPWDLRDDAGRAVGAGLYLVTVETEAGAMVRKVTVAR